MSLHRIIRTTLPSPLALFFVIGYATATVNVALNKPTAQSSTYHRHVQAPGDPTGPLNSTLAVDGIPSQCMDLNYTYDGYFSHTVNDGQLSWWRVDLGEIYNIYRITVCNRGGYYSGLQNGKNVLLNLADQNNPSTPSLEANSGWVNVYTFEASLDFHTIQLLASWRADFQARHVAVYGTEYIVLREVIVEGYSQRERDNVQMIISSREVTEFTIKLRASLEGFSQEMFENCVLELYEVSDPNSKASLHSISIETGGEVLSYYHTGLSNGTRYRYKVELTTYDVVVKTSEIFEEYTELCQGPDTVTDVVIKQSVRDDSDFPVYLDITWTAPLRTGCEGLTVNILYDVFLNGVQRAGDMSATWLILPAMANFQYSIQILVRNYRGHRSISTHNFTSIQTVHENSDTEIPEVESRPTGLSDVGVIGIAVTSFAFGLAVAALVVFVLFRRKRTQQKSLEECETETRQSNIILPPSLSEVVGENESVDTVRTVGAPILMTNERGNSDYEVPEESPQSDKAGEHENTTTNDGQVYINLDQAGNTATWAVQYECVFNTDRSAEHEYTTLNNIK